MPFQNLEDFSVTDAPCTPSNSSTCTWVKHQHQQVGAPLFVITFFCPRSFFQQKHMLYLVGAAHIALGVPSWWRIFGDACLHRDSSDYNDLLCDAVQIHVGTSNHLKRWPAYVLVSSVCYCSSITSVWGAEHKIFWSTADRKGLFCKSPGILNYKVSSSCTLTQYYASASFYCYCRGWHIWTLTILVGKYNFFTCFVLVKHWHQFVKLKFSDCVFLFKLPAMFLISI